MHLSNFPCYVRHSDNLIPPVSLCSLLKLYATRTKTHSALTFSIPLSMNCRKPITLFIIPNTGSTVSFRFLYVFFPLLVFSFRAIFCFALNLIGRREYQQKATAVHGLLYEYSELPQEFSLNDNIIIF